MIFHYTKAAPSESYGVNVNAARSAVLVQATDAFESVRLRLSVEEAEHLVQLIQEAVHRLKTEPPPSYLTK